MTAEFSSWKSQLSPTHVLPFENRSLEEVFEREMWVFLPARHRYYYTKASFPWCWKVAVQICNDRSHSRLGLGLFPQLAPEAFVTKQLRSL